MNQALLMSLQALATLKVGDRSDAIDSVQKLQKASEKMPVQDAAFTEVKETFLLYGVVVNYNLAACYQR